MDRKIKKQVLRMLFNGMYVMTSRNGDGCCAATITWVSQASFHPPLIMAAVRKNSNVFKCMSESQIAAINILAHAQLDVARKFFSGTQGVDGTFNGEHFTSGMTTAPILRSAVAYAECKVRRVVDDLGDHAVVVMEVVETQCRKQVQPLTVAESPWKYGG